jgi:hypothetical protein
MRIIKGDFAGIESEMVHMEGKTHVILRIPQVLVVSVTVPKGYLERI